MQDHVVAALAALPATEVSAFNGNKIVVLLEGGTRSDVGDRLAAIALIDGVLAANMVFEHVDQEEGTGP
jgi:nitrate reductase NapD